jgi:uncharacterized membrane protein YtjA (UPF0391 family)
MVCSPMNRNQPLREGLFKRSFEDHTMLGWALTFLILALIAGFFGFFGLAGLSAGIAKILLFAFVVLFLISALSGALHGRVPPV